ncbi:hypothetical protein [Streptomyces liliiviolaceus]|uniref:hypothetical protein n=1 Tax=Streptomyces liliiviolaceus TaxID=2823109 RepID=UPI001FFCDF4D|nr:hypothetical protein [Streptomyces liliiviolaceus]
MPSVSDEVLVFRLSRRASDSAEWLPTSRLLVQVGDGKSAIPAHLSWVTEDGTQSSVAFSPDMASCYGHRRTTSGDVVEIRGERDDRREYPEGADTARGHEFATETEEAGDWHPAGRLRVLIDDGGEAPVRWLTWGDQTGNTCSLALRSVSPSGIPDVGDPVSVWASAEHRDAGEVARNLVDASAGKWFAPHNRAALEIQLARPIAVDRYVLTSADDAPDRDPAAWTLRGSADGQLWRTLDIRSGQSFGERHQSRTYRIAEPGTYDRYRLDITGNNGSPHLQLEAVRFLADGSAGFIGYRQRAGHAPAAYRGIRIAQAAAPDTPAEPLPEDAPAPSRTTPTTSTPGFPLNTLNSQGTPIWLSELASDDPHHTLHVVRGLEPAQALEALGANPQLFQPCELPAAKPDRWSSLPGAALGIEPGTSAALLAGRIGAWTFVYDDSGFTDHDDTMSLSADGRAAATSMFSINADASLTYTVDGTQLAWIDVDDLDLKRDLPGMPDELRAAFRAAGTVAHDYLKPGQPDYDICMRAICALAGLSCTVEDLRRIPLLVTPFG